MYNPCDAVTLPGGEKPEIVVFTNDQQRALVQASYRHRYGVFIRLDLCTGLRMGELLALKWEDIDFSTAQLHVRRTICLLYTSPTAPAAVIPQTADSFPLVLLAMLALCSAAALTGLVICRKKKH